MFEFKIVVKVISSIFVRELVLDLSKVLIYKFYLDYMIPNGEKTSAFFIWILTNH